MLVLKHGITAAEDNERAATCGLCFEFQQVHVYYCVLRCVTTELYRIRAVVESIYARHRVFVWASNQLQGKSKTARARSAAPLRGPDSYCEKKKSKK